MDNTLLFVLVVLVLAYLSHLSRRIRSITRRTLNASPKAIVMAGRGKNGFDTATLRNIYDYPYQTLTGLSWNAGKSVAEALEAVFQYTAPAYNAWLKESE
jgi:hypothetical protein